MPNEQIRWPNFGGEKIETVDERLEKMETERQSELTEAGIVAVLAVIAMWLPTLFLPLPV